MLRLRAKRFESDTEAEAPVTRERRQLQQRNIGDGHPSPFCLAWLIAARAFLESCAWSNASHTTICVSTRITRPSGGASAGLPSAAQCLIKGRQQDDKVNARKLADNCAFDDTAHGALVEFQFLHPFQALQRARAKKGLNFPLSRKLGLFIEDNTALVRAQVFHSSLRASSQSSMFQCAILGHRARN